MLSASVKLPNFFIVGAPKAGTTSLYAYLAQHPQVYMSPLKETHYFSTEVRAENFSPTERPRIERDALALRRYLDGDLRERRFGGLISSWEDYLRLFRNAGDETAIGEATPHYLWSPSAAPNIAARVPHAKIIISLRNPVDRAFSDYLHMLSVGAVRRSFREQIDANLRCADKRIGNDWPFLEYGSYSEQIRRYLQLFPSSQIHISLYEDLQAAARALLAQLFAFLGVRDDFVVNLAARYNEARVPRLPGTVYFLKRWGLWSHVRKLAAEPLRAGLRSWLLQPRGALRMDAADRAFLTDYYRTEIKELEGLVGRDLSPWLHARPAVPRE